MNKGLAPCVLLLAAICAGSVFAGPARPDEIDRQKQFNSADADALKK